LETAPDPEPAASHRVETKSELPKNEES